MCSGGMVLKTLTKRAGEPFRYKGNDLNVLASIDYKSSFQSQHLYYGFTNFRNSLDSSTECLKYVK